MRRDPFLLVFVLGVGVATLALKESKPLARKIGKFLVKAGEEFMKAGEEPTKPPVVVAEVVSDESQPAPAEHVTPEDHTGGQQEG